MKTSTLRFLILGIILLFSASSIAFGQAGTVRTQNTWAKPVLRDQNCNIVQPGTALLPSTIYYVTIEALPPIATDNQGNMAINVEYLESGDGIDPSYLPDGLDVPRSGRCDNSATARTYRADIITKTDVAANLPPQLYVRYRALSFEINPATNVAEGTPTVRVQQVLLP